MSDLTWPSAQDAKTDYNVTVTGAQLATAREECLRAVGLPLTAPVPPSASFREAVALQALANQQSTQADQTDWTGSETNGVRLYPMSKAIRSKLIVPDLDPGTFADAVLTWPSGAKVELSRLGNIVTARVTPDSDAAADLTAFPADYFKPADVGTITNYVHPNYVAIVQATGIFMSPVDAGPFLPGTIQWVASGAATGKGSRDRGLVRSLIG